MSRADIFQRVERIVISKASDRESLKSVAEALREAALSWDWVGFYLLAGGVLKLGPYSGEPTDFTRIEIGDGVCGTAVAEDRNQIVDDVRALDNYIACSLKTRSEIVVLIRHEGNVVGQFDIDSDERAAFTEEDETLLEELAQIVAPRCASLAAAL